MCGIDFIHCQKKFAKRRKMYRQQVAGIHLWLEDIFLLFSGNFWILTGEFQEIFNLGLRVFRVLKERGHT